MDKTTAITDSADTGQSVTRFSETLSKPLETLFKAGGFALVFIFVSFVMMLIGHLNTNYLSIYFFTIGAVMNFTCLLFFLFSQLRGPIKARHVLKENEELLDSVQDIAIRLTDSVSNLQSLMFKHSEYVRMVMETASPIISQIPGLKNIDFTKSNNINSLIANSTEKAQIIIRDIKHSLTTCEVDNLRKYSDDLQALGKSLREALKSPNELLNTLPNYKEMVAVSQQTLSKYSDNLDMIHSYLLNYIEIGDRFIGQLDILRVFGSASISALLLKIKEASIVIKDVACKSKEANNIFKTALIDGDLGKLKASLSKLQDANATLQLLIGKSHNDTEETANLPHTTIIEAG